MKKYFMAFIVDTGIELEKGFTCQEVHGEMCPFDLIKTVQCEIATKYDVQASKVVFTSFNEVN